MFRSPPEDIKLKLEEYWEFELNNGTALAKISIKGVFLHRHTAFGSEYAKTFEKGSVREAGVCFILALTPEQKKNAFLETNIRQMY